MVLIFFFKEACFFLHRKSCLHRLNNLRFYFMKVVVILQLGFDLTGAFFVIQLEGSGVFSFFVAFKGV